MSNFADAITVEELAVFKSRLVVKGTPSHASVISQPVARDWENILWAGEPELFVDGEFDRVLTLALQEFADRRELERG